MSMKTFGGMSLAWFVATIVAVTIAVAAVDSVRSEVTDVPTALGISASGAIATAAEQLEAATGGASDIELAKALTLAPAAEPEPTGPDAVEATPVVTTTTTETTTTTIPEQVAVQEASAQRDEPTQPPATRATPPATTRAPAKPATITTTTTTTTTTPPVRPSPTQQPQSETSTSAPTTTSTTTTTAPAPSGYTREIETDGGRFYVNVEGDTVTLATAYAKDAWQFALLNGGPTAVDVQFVSIDFQYPTIRVHVTVIHGTLIITNGPQ